MGYTWYSSSGRQTVAILGKWQKKIIKNPQLAPLNSEEQSIYSVSQAFQLPATWQRNFISTVCTCNHSLGDYIAHDHKWRQERSCLANRKHRLWQWLQLWCYRPDQSVNLALHPSLPRKIFDTQLLFQGQDLSPNWINNYKMINLTIKKKNTTFILNIITV